MDTTILILLLSISILKVIEAKDKYADCKSTYTLGYGYKHIYHISESGTHHDANSFMFNFSVMASSDAHVLLSPTGSPGNQDPVYEIVIGAGKNTFTDIRRQIRAQSKARIITMDYLSDTEYRGFWIRLSRFGHIEIGKSEENTPFIFWIDPEPLLIHYFSFCTWGSVVGRWYYSCPNDTQSEEVDVPIQLTTLEQLRQDLLLHYDPYSRPILNESDTTYVNFHLLCQHITVDEKKSTLSIAGEVTLQWQDQKLQWKPEDYDNISLLTVLHHEVWQPELVLYNAVTSATDILTNTPLMVSSLGSVLWKSQAKLNVRCRLDLSQWPNDEHTCEILLGFWAQHEVLHLNLMAEGATYNGAQSLSSEWNVLSLEADPTKLKTPWVNTTSDLNDNKALSIRLTIRRKPQAYRALLLVPFLVFATLILSSFWISPTDSNKILLSCISLVITSMFIVALGTILPASKVPQIVITYSHGMVAAALSILNSIVVIAFSRYNHIHPLPGLLRTLLNMKTLQIMLCLPPIAKKGSTNYEHLQENEEQCEITPPEDASSASNWEIQQQWILLATITDRLAFIIYLIYLTTVMLNHS